MTNYTKGDMKMYHNDDVKNFKEYVNKFIMCNFKSDTPDMYSFINLIKVDKFHLGDLISLFAKWQIPYKICDENDKTIYFKYLEQYDKRKKSSVRLFDIFREKLFSIPHDYISGSSVTKENVIEFDEINLGDRRSIFFIDSEFEEDVSNISMHFLGLNVVYTRIDIKEDLFKINGLSWFVINDKYEKNIRNDKSDSMQLIEAFINSGIQHFILYDSHGTIKPDIRIKKRSDSRKSVHKFRNDLKSHFRSTWEANIARILNYLNIDWSYEKDSFYMGTGVYIPDFWLPDQILLEIKGFWDTASVNKVFWFKSNVPDFKLYIIDADIYYDLSQMYKNKIADWEEDSIVIKKEIIPIVGINITERKKYVAELKQGDELILLRDPANPFDNNAIKALDLNLNHIGFLSKEWAAIYADKIDLGMQYSVTIQEKQKNCLYVTIERNSFDQEYYYPFFFNK
jgi:hypothetical protein